jgi:uncharacterized protein
MKKHLAAVASAFAFSLVPMFAYAAPAVDPAAIEASRQLMEVMKYRELVIMSLQQAEKQLPAQMKSVMTGMVENDTTMSAEQKKAALAKVDASTPAIAKQAHALYADPSLVDDIVSETLPLYARTYTVDELKQMVVLYRSPLGQKMLATMPQLMAECAEISNRVMVPRIQKTMSQLVLTLGSN